MLLNVALHGMEEAAGVRYQTSGAHAGETVTEAPWWFAMQTTSWRYASAVEQAEEVKARLAIWLAPRGLAFNEDKTRVVHLDEGLTFSGSMSAAIRASC